MVQQTWCNATSFTDAQDIVRARSLLEEHCAALLELEDNLGNQGDVKLLGLYGCIETHALDQNGQKVSGSRRRPREHLSRNGGGRHADAIAILDEVRGRDAGADDVLVVL